jgi:ring-1,2-phenylacetyl-CoA epoxidase subunit PaaC
VSATPKTDPATACMISLVASLADNKAALGRRYGEWAVSAPSLESAVAAAAMAQDELGHARSTYPVLKALGMHVDEDSAEAEGDRRLALLDAELPDWSSFIAANLLVDGVLVTFVAACADSTLAPMAQRARKILQEEGSHRVHAEAWTRRLCRSGESERDALLERLAQTWEQAGRWIGPDDDPGLAAAVQAGMLSEGAAAQRDRVRRWLVERLAREGVAFELPEPTDWTRWDPVRRRLEV